MKSIVAATIAVFIGIFAATWYVGAHYDASPTVVVTQNVEALPSDEDGFAWELAALVLTGLGTTALALATAGLALVTRKDVANAQKTADSAREANEIARSEIAATPAPVHSRGRTTPTFASGDQRPRPW